MKVPSPEHGEDTLLLVVADQRIRQLEALHAVTARWSQRDERIERQPSHRADLAGIGHDLDQFRAGPGRQKHSQIRVSYDHAAPWGELVKHVRQ